MRKQYAWSLLACIFAVTLMTAPSLHATDAPLVISQVQLGNADSAKSEFIELYNNTATAIEVTQWCLQYISATQTQTVTQLACFAPAESSVHLFLPGYAPAFAIANQLAQLVPRLGSDLVFQETLSGTAGYVRLIDTGGNEIDRVGWGAAAHSAEGANPAPVPAIGQVLQRKMKSAPLLQDTNNNNDDFELVAPRLTYSYGSLYEVRDLCRNLDGIQASIPTDYTVGTGDTCLPPPADMCLNIDGLQASLPIGYAADSSGDCAPDVCQNLVGLQREVPIGYDVDLAGVCVEHDECLNIVGSQPVVPDGYRLAEAGRCLLDLLPLQLTELLANPAGVDSGNEFVELYNPNDTAVELGLYRLRVGKEAPRLFAFPMGSSIAAHSYRTFSNDEIAFTLVNTVGQVAVMTSDGTLVDETIPYDSPPDAMAWALIDTVWQYTNQVTPGSINRASLIDATTDDVVTASVLAPCAANQYRSTETGRCRLLAASSSVMAPCKDGQYRSEETNRCRSIASDASATITCDADQERNPETGRCRLIAAATTTPVACKEGQERNPETNRCHTIATLPLAAYPVEATIATPGSPVGWIALGGIGSLAAGYGAWEWRGELAHGIRRIRSFVHFKK